LNDDNELTYKGKFYCFIDIADFNESCSGLLSEKQMKDIVNDVRSFVQDIKRPVSTKDRWYEIFDDS